MAFDQSTILGGPYTSRRGGELVVTWDSAAPAGATFQLYADGVLVWAGTARRCLLDGGYAGALLRVGTVPAAERLFDHGAGLPAVPGAAVRPRLTFYGGTFLSPTLAAFRIYRGPAPDGPADVTGTPIATLPAYPRARPLDGFGLGPFGYGGFGQAATAYRWVGDPLPAGTWNFAVVPYDAAGAAGPPQLAAVTIAAPPDPPAGLAYAYDPATRQVTLTWS